MSESTKPSRKPIHETLLEITRLHTQAAMRAEGATTGTGPRVSGSKPGSARLSYAGGLPLVEELERAMRRHADYWTAVARATTPGEVRKARTSAILAEVGMDPTAVAYIYGSTTEAVRKARGRAGFDPATGQQVSALNQERIDGKASRQRPLTAPPHTVIDALEPALTDE